MPVPIASARAVRGAPIAIAPDHKKESSCHQHLLFPHAKAMPF
jgi:hypothetical protein